MWDDLCPSSIQRLRLLWQRGQWEVKVIPQQPGNSGCCVRILRYLGWHKSGGCSTSPDLPFPLSDLISLRVKRMWDLFSLLFFEVNFSVPLALAEWQIRKNCTSRPVSVSHLPPCWDLQTGIFSLPPTCASLAVITGYTPDFSKVTL